MGVLLMLLTIGMICLAIILLIVAGFARRGWLAIFAVGAMAVWLIIYAVLLLTVSLKSQEKVLAMNEPKEFCGFYFDCHLHAAVTNVRTAKQLGSQTAQGTFIIVRVKVFNDAQRESLNLTEAKAKLYDEGPRIYSHRLEAEKELDDAAKPDFNQKVAAGGEFEKEIVFDVTEPAQELKLLITEGYGIEKTIEAVLIGDEDSIFHQPSYFKLDAQAQITSAN